MDSNYFSRTGFHIEIIRPLESIFNSVVYKNSVEFFTVTPTTNHIYLNEKGDYSFMFSDFSSSDPTEFLIKKYDTEETIVSLVFPLTTRLILLAGIDGQTEKDLSVKYPLTDVFVITNPGAI